MKNITRLGIRLAFLLRHDKKYCFDEHGWRSVADLIDNHGYSPEILDKIVETNNKQRFEYSFDKSKIRARQGHSVNVNVELTVATPPEILYHGTSIDVKNEILQHGILKGNRLHVHLSEREDTAINVGKRHGEPTVLKINARQMHLDCIIFYISNNGVWLTDYVSPEYIVD